MVFGVPIIFKIFKDYMDLKRTNCIYCPESVMHVVQTTYKNHFSRAKAFKIFTSEKLLIDLRSIEEQNLILEQTHDRSHRGIWENHQEILRRFYFPRMKFKVREYIKLCETCHKNKYDRHPYKVALGSTPRPERPLDIVHIDIYIAEKTCFLSAIDKFSRYGSLIHIKSRNILDLRKGLTKYFKIFGTPRKIVCDNEPSLRSIEIRGLLHDLGVEVFFIPPNHSESNGLVERFHSTINEIFRCIKPAFESLTTKEILNIACTQYNNTIHSSIKLKPREAFYGLKDDQERPLQIEKIVESRNKLYDEIMLAHDKSNKRALDYHNINREPPPDLNPDQVAYNKIQGIKKKTKPMYSPVTVVDNKGRVFIDDNGREIHKDNVKRV